MQVWRLADGTPVGEPITGHENGVYTVAVGALPNGTPIIISGGVFHDTPFTVRGGGAALRVWRLADGTPVGQPITGHDHGVYAVAVGRLPDGTAVIVSGGGDGDGTVRVWHRGPGVPVQPWKGVASR